MLSEESRMIRWAGFSCSSLCDSFYLSLQPFVSEMDLRVALLPAGVMDYLRQAMPVAPDGGFDYEGWLDQVFA